MNYEELPQWQLSVYRFDPTDLYARIKVDFFKRKQSIGIENMFPKIAPGICVCGCGVLLEGKKRRWASDECQDYAVAIHQIIGGDSFYVDKYLEMYYGSRNCNKCGNSENDKPPGIYPRNFLFIQKDHILPVTKGGGGCWLDNYQFLCDTCHKQKTKIDNQK